MLTTQMKIIEYWRKKYLVEAVVVLAIALVMVALALFYMQSFWLKMLVIGLAIVISYVMIKELKADLQTRGEALILAKEKELFNGVEFDYGQGLKESELLKLNVFENYMMRECQNVMKGAHYYLEEDWLYSIISAKFMAFNQTVFKGIVAVIDRPKVENLKGEISLAQGQIEVKGAVGQMFDKNDLETKLKPLFSLFKAGQMQIVGSQGKVYFLIRTEKPIFYQFSLLKYNTLSAFVARIQQLDEVLKNL